MKPVLKGGAFAARLAMIAALLVGTAMPVSANETASYSYDALGRLVKVARSGTVNNGASECYAYDAASNRTNVKVNTSGDCGSGTGGVSFSIASNGPVTEGVNSVFTITKSGTASADVAVTYATANGTAVGGSGTCPSTGDYRSKAPTSLTFTPAQQSKTVSVITCDDTTAESAETFTMNLSAPTGGATIGTGTATATLNDNDGTPTCNGVTFSVASNGAVTEGVSSVFTVTKSGTASGSCSVSYASANGTAIAGSDYTTKTGTLTFTSAQASQTVNVVTTDDTTVESAETFTMNLSAPTGGATLGTASATATLNDNDSSGICSGVNFNLIPASATEGSPVVFTVGKSGAPTVNCSVNYATSNGTAVAPGDYTATSGTLTFSSAQNGLTISVTTANDGLTESTETFTMTLSGASAGATISPATGSGTINDGNSACSGVVFSSSSPTTLEGDSLLYVVTKTGASSAACTIDYASENSGAVAGVDYYSAAGTLTFASGGNSSQSVAVETIDDVRYETNEGVNLRLSNPSSGATVSGLGIGVILDNDSCDPQCESPIQSPGEETSSPEGSTEPPPEATEPPPEGK